MQDKDFDDGVVEMAELMLVDNKKSEWLHWYDLGKCKEPSDWDITDAAKKEIRLDGS